MQMIAGLKVMHRAIEFGRFLHTKLHKVWAIRKTPETEPNNHLDAQSRSAHLAKYGPPPRLARAARPGAPGALMAELVAYVDGGSLGNPGPSGIGVVISGLENGPIRIAKWIGHQDNNVAEYIALME